MKLKKKMASLVLIVVMAVSLFSACGNSEQVEETATGGNTETVSADTETNAETESDVVEEEEEVTEIKMMVLSLGAQGEGAVAVEEKLNEITEKEINVHVTLDYVEPGQYSQQLNLAVAGNEDLDLVMVTPIPPAGFSALTANGALVPLNDLMAEYGQETMDLLGDLTKGTTLDGQVYALPTYRDLASGAYILMRKDMLEEAGLLEKAENMTTWAEYEEIMTQVTEQFGINGTGNNDADGTILNLLNVWLDGETFADASSFDSLGDSLKIIASDDNGKVISYYESDKYKDMIAKVRSWYDKGLVYKDSATSDDVVDSLLKNNVYFSAVINGELGVAATHTAASGHELIAKQVAGIETGTGAMRKFGWAIPVCSKEQEAAAKFLNLMFTSPEVSNLLSWGIEGKDYVVEDGIAKFPEGVTTETVAYHTADFLYGNQFITLPWDGNAADTREVAMEEMEKNGLSSYLGFSCDTTNIANELAAIVNVTSEYMAGLNSGILGEAEYADFIEKLKAAGIDRVVEEYQTQLDAWVAANQ